jgi:hypothetical protein
MTDEVASPAPAPEELSPPVAPEAQAVAVEAAPTAPPPASE